MDSAQVVPDELAPLHNATVDRATVNQLFDDIAECTQLIEIMAKQGGQKRVREGESFTLTTAREALLSNSLVAVQIRYVFNGEQWWDTIMAMPDGAFRIVRIRQPF